jgi:hypothetical protein
MSDQMGGYIVFGPDARNVAPLVARGVAEANKGGCIVCDERTDALRRSMKRTLPGDSMSPCVLTFAHYIPPKRNVHVNNSQARAWVSRFGSSISPHLWMRCGNPTVNWDASNSGDVTLTINWPRVQADVCLQLAEAIEEAFDQLRNTSVKRKWWQFWK